MTIKDLKENNLILFECISGSKAYGLDTEKSDTDIKGVFYLPKESFYGLQRVEQVNNESNDEVYYELGRFVELLIKNNPNLLELLATPDSCVMYKHPLMAKLNINMFLSKLCRETFAGYAMSQVQKARGLKKKIVNPMEQVRRSVMDFCFVTQGYSSIPLKEWLAIDNRVQERCGLTAIPHAKGLYAVFYDERCDAGYKGVVSGESANELSVSSIPKGSSQVAYLYFNADSYSSYCKDFREYWDWVENRNDERYTSNMQHGKNYDAKNMMHTIRLLQVALEILEHGKLNVKRNNRQELLAIKNGDLEYEQLLQKADDLMSAIEKAAETTTLPVAPDKKKIECVLVEMREELYKQMKQNNNETTNNRQ